MKTIDILDAELPPLTKQQKLNVEKLLDAPREWTQWQIFSEWLLGASAPSEAKSASVVCYVCSRCGHAEQNQNALNAHMRKHK